MSGPEAGRVRSLGRGDDSRTTSTTSSYHRAWLPTRARRYSPTRRLLHPSMYYLYFTVHFIEIITQHYVIYYNVIITQDLFNIHSNILSYFKIILITLKMILITDGEC